MERSLVSNLYPWILLALGTISGACSATNPNKALAQMIGQEHLGPHSEVADPAARATINSQIDGAASALATLAARGASRSELLSELDSRINAIDRDGLSTEDAESVASAFEAMLEPLGLESSDGILNTWIYGFDPQ